MSPERESRVIVGIDLGTTNSVLAYVDTGAADAAAPASGVHAPIRVLEVPQVVAPGDVAPRDLLPSFIYIAGEHDLPEGSLDLPWAGRRRYGVGEFARERGAEVPGRVVASAKSWLRHAGVDRTSPLLPWEAPEDVPRLSPLAAQERILEHLRDAWNARVTDKNLRLEKQEVYLTVPASFDAAARELTARAAAEAGFEHVTLIEEPQAAFYAWLDHLGEAWREKVEVGDLVLVCDVGGGTTDLSLIAVSEEAGGLVLERVAVGDHLLLGGDNMDLALAHAVAAKLARDGHKLDGWQMRSLWHSSRAAKERLLADEKAASEPIVVLGRGSKLIGGSIRTELTRDDVVNVLVDGFFPVCGADERPHAETRTGMRELGLPYEADPAVTRHIAWFLARHAPEGENGRRLPTAVLMNGGVMKSPALAGRVMEVLGGWAGSEVKLLESADLDLAVARGAAYYGLARRGRGVRIRGGTARAYYIGIETAMPAVPGVPAPLKAVCVAPFGMEEGSEAALEDREFGLVIGEPVAFRLLASSVRPDDRIGTVVESWEQEDLEELEPVVATLPAAEGTGGTTVPVRIVSRVTEIGTLEIWCVSRDAANRRWKLEFNVREQVTEQPR
jgi:molecular chaperone DnaK (HSP70)